MVLEFRQLTDLIATICQRLQKIVILIFIKESVRLRRVVKFSWALQSQLEAGFRQAAFFNRCIHKNRLRDKYLKCESG